MRKQLITIEVTVPDEDGNDPEQILAEVMDDYTQGGPGYSWQLASVEPPVETKRQSGPVAWHRAYIQLNGQPAVDGAQMREALTEIAGSSEYDADSPAWATCVEDPDYDPGWWHILLRPDHPLVEHVVTRAGNAEVEIPEL